MGKDISFIFFSNYFTNFYQNNVTRNMDRLIPLFSLLIMGCQHPNAQGELPLEIPNERPYNIEMVLDGVQNPWGMDWLPDGSMLITEKSGDL
ncbi:MAG: PQQ-dependent sugar dehydrogenase, partial [Flavobacteriaceae bacterium]|nr:PQQ-dependent sugar dehydrogenase [Flavobacteriaceae bacterium]